VRRRGETKNGRELRGVNMEKEDWNKIGLKWSCDLWRCRKQL